MKEYDVMRHINKGYEWMDKIDKAIKILSLKDAEEIHNQVIEDLAYYKDELKGELELAESNLY